MTNVVSLQEYKNIKDEEVEDTIADVACVTNNVTDAVAQILEACGVNPKEYDEHLAEIYDIVFDMVESSGVYSQPDSSNDDD